MSDLSTLVKDSQGLPAAFRKDQPIGTVWSGKVVRVVVRQQRDDDGTPKEWDDGNPMQEVIVAIQTEQRNPERTGDDGVRGIYVKWWGAQKAAFLDALRAAGVDDIEAGGMFAAQYVDNGPQPRDPKLSPAKLFKFEYKAPSGMAGLLNGNGNGAAKVQEALVAPSTAVPAAPRLPQGMEPLPAAPAAAPAAAQAPAPAAAQAVDPMALLTQLKALIGLGFDDAQIIAATGVNPDALAAIRSLPA